MSSFIPREISDKEKGILQRMLSAGIPHSEEILEQIEGVSVAVLDNFGSLRFLTEDRNRLNLPDGPIINALQVDQETESDFGPYVNYIIFVKDGRVCELQIYKDDDSPITSMLDASKIISVFPGKHSL